jgi:hypothetical protein
LKQLLLKSRATSSATLCLSYSKVKAFFRVAI